MGDAATNLVRQTVDQSDQPLALMQAHDAAAPWRVLEHRQPLVAATVDDVQMGPAPVDRRDGAEQRQRRGHSAAG
jgi:hypothetical protein